MTNVQGPMTREIPVPQAPAFVAPDVRRGMRLTAAAVRLLTSAATQRTGTLVIPWALDIGPWSFAESLSYAKRSVTRFAQAAPAQTHGGRNVHRSRAGAARTLRTVSRALAQPHSRQPLVSCADARAQSRRTRIAGAMNQNHGWTQMNTDSGLVLIRVTPGSFVITTRKS